MPSLSGPKRPHDRVSVSEMKTDFENCLVNPAGESAFFCWPYRYLIEVDCSSGQFKSAKLKDKECTGIHYKCHGKGSYEMN